MNKNPIVQKFESLVERLVNKIELSQTPVPGFIMGLSGTDSIIAFLLCYEALARKNMANRMFGIHYADKFFNNTVFRNKIMKEWLPSKCPEADFIVAVPTGGNTEQLRWADLHTRAVEENYWIAGTMNATEKELGSYSNISTAVSLQPIRSFWKSEILELCKEFDVPEQIIQNARIPDCLCGRAELAAENIELIDDILRFKVDISNHDPQLLTNLYSFIQDEKRQNDFKKRIPYIL